MLRFLIGVKPVKHIVYILNTYYITSFLWEIFGIFKRNFDAF